MTKLSSLQFKKFCDLVYAEAGIHLTSEKRELLNARLAKRLRALRVPVDEYYRLIQSDGDELWRFLDAISTNHTYFFRESKSFAYLDPSRPKIWCAASSSGEEPYSLVVHCLEQGFSPTILATDISETCLAKGRRGIYKDQAAQHIPRPLLRAYFQRGHGEWDGYFRVKEAVRQRVRFDRFNLLKDSPPADQFDMVFCRNVMIYFDRPTKEHVVAKLAGVLKPAGYFIIGGAESLSGLRHPLKYIEPSVYRKE